MAHTFRLLRALQTIKSIPLAEMFRREGYTVLVHKAAKPTPTASDPPQVAWLCYRLCCGLPAESVS